MQLVGAAINLDYVTERQVIRRGSAAAVVLSTGTKTYLLGVII